MALSPKMLAILHKVDAAREELLRNFCPNPWLDRWPKT